MSSDGPNGPVVAAVGPRPRQYGLPEKRAWERESASSFQYLFFAVLKRCETGVAFGVWRGSRRPWVWSPTEYRRSPSVRARSNRTPWPVESRRISDRLRRLRSPAGPGPTAIEETGERVRSPGQCDLTSFRRGIHNRDRRDRSPGQCDLVLPSRLLSLTPFGQSSLARSLAHGVRSLVARHRHSAQFHLYIATAPTRTSGIVHLSFTTCFHTAPAVPSSS